MIDTLEKDALGGTPQAPWAVILSGKLRDGPGGPVIHEVWEAHRDLDKTQIAVVFQPQKAFLEGDIPEDYLGGRAELDLRLNVVATLHNRYDRWSDGRSTSEHRVACFADDEGGCHYRVDYAAIDPGASWV